MKALQDKVKYSCNTLAVYILLWKFCMINDQLKRHVWAHESHKNADEEM